MGDIICMQSQLSAECFFVRNQIGGSGGELGVGAGKEFYRHQQGLEGGEGVSLGFEHS